MLGGRVAQEVGWKEWGLTGSGLEGMGAHRVGQTDDDQAKGVAIGTDDSEGWRTESLQERRGTEGPQVWRRSRSGR